MKKKQIESFADIAVTAEERQAIYQRLLERNHIRREIGIRPMDVPAQYRRKVQQLADQKYWAAITPFLKRAYQIYPGNMGLPSRLQQHVQVIEYCERRAGLPPHQRRAVNFMEFLKLYQTGKLPLVRIDQ